MKKFIRVFIVLATLSGLTISQLGQLYAQSNALAIPPRKDYTLKPGESVSDTLTVTNSDPQTPLQLKLTVIHFTAQDESGTPQLIRDQGVQKTAWSLRSFIKMPEQILLDAGATVRIPIFIEMPADIGAGSYYSAIEYAAVNDLAQDKVNISASGVTLAFVKVPGKATQQLNFEQFGAFRPDKSGTGGTFAGLFFNTKPGVLAYRLKNEGNIAEQPIASIVVKNFSGDTLYTIGNANVKNQLALRGQTRRFETCIAPENVQQTTENGVEVDTVVCGDTNFSPGRYTAELSVLYGENGNETREITAKTSFWYLPWWFVGLVVAGLAIVVAAISYVVRRVQSFRNRKTRRR